MNRKLDLVLKKAQYFLLHSFSKTDDGGLIIRASSLPFNSTEGIRCMQSPEKPEFMQSCNGFGDEDQTEETFASFIMRALFSRAHV